ncbi:hypothetical protein [Nocardia brasiliensis]|uniref:hypothetical protein n=1 Tax=Nocardia brasiliensis TaxID=37326 RepID=UPI002458F636|nr:hypothetical protein [Nocardia brasiliensis]
MSVSRTRRMLAVVSRSATLGPSAARVLADLAGPRDVDIATTPARAPAQPEYDQVLTRARRFLDAVAPDDPLSLVLADSLEALPDALAAAAAGHAAVLTLLVIDHDNCRYRAAEPDTVNRMLAKVAISLPGTVEFDPGPHTVHVYTAPDLDTFYAEEHFTPRWQPEHDWVVAADIACAFVDSLQVHLHQRLRPDFSGSAVARELSAFLNRRAGQDWGLHYYTGSGVATFIDDMEAHATANGNPIVRAPSEHSHGCSALARWTLDGAPFVIVTTSGMHDEFRGTLANHVATRSKGFIVCCDSRPNQWHPFQGTIHRTGDARPSLQARGFPVVYIERTEHIGEGLQQAFAAYDADRGPVMILATREVLQANPEMAAPVEPVAPDRPAATDLPELARLSELLNSARVRLLCQVGPLSGNAQQLMYELSHRAGIALADSVAQPGTVTRYRDGTVVPEYLGTLSMYGYSARVHQYLYDRGELRPADEQQVIFLNSAIPQIDTPFADSSLRRLAPIQIVEHAVDQAPFAGLTVTGNIEKVLRALLDRLDVDPEVLAYRRAAIAASTDSYGDVVGLLPLRPMTTNYFFRRLGSVLEELIQQRDYRYVGVYDIGRVGLTAVNNLPRTNRGFSGWYGRGLMGDGLMALPGVVTRRDEHVLCFTGDGSAAMTPDILPALVHQIAVDRAPMPKSLNIFRFVNGSHSVIRTYREGLRPGAVSGQTGVLTFTPEDWDRRVGPLTIRHRRVIAFDDVPFADQLDQSNTINLYSIFLGHNNEGDGLSRFSVLGWQRDELAPAALAAAGTALPS